MPRGSTDTDRGGSQRRLSARRATPRRHLLIEATRRPDRRALAARVQLALSLLEGAGFEPSVARHLTAILTIEFRPEPSIMPERFTETLRAASEPAWSDAVGHRFVEELFAGAVPNAVMAGYFIQDHRFLDNFLTLLGAALASADTFEARLRFGRFIGIVSGEENTYFFARSRRSASPSRRAAIPTPHRPPASRRSCVRRRKRASMPPRCGPRRGRVARSQLGLARAQAVTGQLRACGVDHAAR